MCASLSHITHYMIKYSPPMHFTQQCTLLYTVAMFNHIDVLNELIRFGADVNHQRTYRRIDDKRIYKVSTFYLLEMKYVA